MSAYVVLDPRPFGRYQRGTVLDIEAMRGEPLAKQGVVLAISAKEAGQARREPGALPLFADENLQKILVARGLAEAPERNVSKSSILKR